MTPSAFKNDTPLDLLNLSQIPYLQGKNGANNGANNQKFVIARNKIPPVQKLHLAHVYQSKTLLLMA